MPVFDKYDPSLDDKHRHWALDLISGIILQGVALFDEFGNIYNRTNPIATDNVPKGSAFQNPFITTEGSAQAGIDGRFGAVGAIDVHDGTDTPLWTGDAGTAGASVTFDDATRGFDGSALSVRVVNMGVGTFFDFDAPAPVDISGFVALEFRVWVEGAWTAGDLVEVFAIDGTGEIGNRVDLGAAIERSRTGEWQSAVIPVASLGVTTITGFRINQSLGAGARPTYSLDAIKIHLTGGPVIFAAAALPGTLIRINTIVATFSDAAYDGTQGIGPKGFLSVPTLPSGILAGVRIGGVLTVTSLWRNLEDLGKTRYFMERPLARGMDTAIHLVTDLRANPVVIAGPAPAYQLEFHIMDDLSALKAEVWWIGTIELLT